MKNVRLTAAAFGFFANFLLFLVKLYAGVSSNSLPIICDAVNNFGDTLACIVAFVSFLLIKKLGEREANRAQSLCTFVISILIAVTGIYFVYRGLERLMYPLPVVHGKKYALIVAATVLVKLAMGFIFIGFNKRAASPVIRALTLDSFLDCFITLFALLSLLLSTTFRYTVDGAFAVITGSIITASAVKSIFNETKFIIKE